MRIAVVLFSLLLLSACGQDQTEEKTDNNQSPEDKNENMDVRVSVDPHSFSRPLEAKVEHLNLDIEVDFDKKQIEGTASYDISTSEDASQLILDTKELAIQKVEVDGDEVAFKMGNEDNILGTALIIPVTSSSKNVSIHYHTTEGAEALQWLGPQQTAGKKMPFLFTQSQAILARTWIPCQDGPGIRFTYNAKVKVPSGMLALMSAENPTLMNEEGVYDFKMKQPIPSYLMALSVGDIAFASIGKRTGVYAEPSLLDASVYEFADMEEMLEGAEKLYGPYVWERYDLIVLPPSFPFGGMENPRLTFATPTILAGDRSLTALVAHELAHSWSGNLVTNAIWDDFWLNEGFTVYFEQRIMEELYGRELSEMLALLSFEGLQEEIREISAKKIEDTHLKLDLNGRNPDDGLTAIAYDKGYLFLRMLEETYGRDRFDSFLRAYFEENAFKIMDTESFIGYLDENLLSLDQDLKKATKFEDWIYGPGLPGNCPVIESNRLNNVEEQMEKWLNGEQSLTDIATGDWVYQEWQHFVRNLPETLDQEQIQALDRTFNLTATGNNEVLCEWLTYGLKNSYPGVDERVKLFLMEIGRRKFLKPVYSALIEADPSKKRAREIYKDARANYHAVSVNTLDEMLDWKE